VWARGAQGAHLVAERQHCAPAAEVGRVAPAQLGGRAAAQHARRRLVRACIWSATVRPMRAACRAAIDRISVSGGHHHAGTSAAVAQALELGARVRQARQGMHEVRFKRMCGLLPVGGRGGGTSKRSSTGGSPPSSTSRSAPAPARPSAASPCAWKGAPPSAASRGSPPREVAARPTCGSVAGVRAYPCPWLAAARGAARPTFGSAMGLGVNPIPGSPPLEVAARPTCGSAAGLGVNPTPRSPPPEVTARPTCGSVPELSTLLCPPSKARAELACPGMGPQARDAGL